MLEELKEKAQDATKRLDQLSDELADRARRGGEEVREALEAIGPAVDKLRERLARLGSSAVSKAQEAELQSALAMMEARDRWKALQDHLREAADWIEEKGGEGRQAIDRSRIQAHLAKMEAEEEIERRGEEARRILAKGKSTLYRETVSTLDGMIGNLDRLRSRLAGDDRPKTP